MESKEKVNDSAEVDQKSQDEQSTKTHIVSKLEHALPDRGITKIEKFLDILKAYVVASSKGTKAISYNDFDGVTDFSSKVISGSNKFLKEIGLIEPEKGKSGFFKPTKALVEFQRLRDWNQDEEAKKILRNVLKTTWFAESVEMVLCMNNPAPETALLAKLGIASGAEKGKHDGPIRSILDLMSFAGMVIKNDDGTYSRGSMNGVSIGDVQSVPPIQSTEEANVEDAPEEELPSERSVGPSPPLCKSDAQFVVKNTSPVSIQFVFNISNDVSSEKIKEIVTAIKEALNGNQ